MTSLEDLLSPIEGSIIEADERVLGRCLAARYVFPRVMSVAVFTTPDRLTVQRVKRKWDGEYEARGEPISIVPERISRVRATNPSRSGWSRDIPKSMLDGPDVTLKIRLGDRQRLRLAMGKIGGRDDEQRRGVEAIGKWFASHADQMPTA